MTDESEKSPENKANGKQAPARNTLPGFSSIEGGFSDALRSLADEIDDETMEYASFCTVDFVHEHPDGGQSQYLGTTFIIHSGVNQGFPNNLGLYFKLGEEVKPQIEAMEKARKAEQQGVDPPGIIEGKRLANLLASSIN